jgi:HEXXH motif-containing protein
VIRCHRIAGDTFAALAAGGGGPDAVRGLRAAQLSRHLLLLKFIADEWPGDPGHRDAALAALAEAQAKAPDTVADLLTEPMIGAWVSWTVRRIRGSATSNTPLRVDLGHLGSVAAAAVARAGLDAELTAYVRDGAVAVPTLGRAGHPRSDFAAVRLRVRRGELEVKGWEGLRWITADAGGKQLRLALDDLDPYRDCHHIPAAGRLRPDQLPEWNERFAQAWDLLVRYAPARADELAAGLRCLVPLADLGPGPARSATARDSFGSFGLTTPESAVDFAVTLVHEFQHSKLSALLDLVSMYDADAPDRYYAPWRLDPRPVGGLLQGVYAFLGVADLWHRLRAAPGLGELAEREFAVIREQVRHALRTLRGSPALTAPGRRLAAGLNATMDSLMAEPLPAPVTRQARSALARNHEAWRARNG